jgi:hypothetical protein
VFFGLSLASTVPLLILGLFSFAGTTIGLIPWLLAYALPGLIVAAAYPGLARRKGWASFWDERQALKGDLQNSGSVLMPGQLSAFLALRVERFLLPLLSGPESLGLYAAVGGLMDGIFGPLRTWIDFSLARWSSPQHARFRLKFFATSLAVAAMLLLAVTPLALLAHFLIDNLFPPQYVAASALVLPLALSSVFIGSYLFHRGNLVARGRFIAARNGDMLVFLCALGVFSSSLFWGSLTDLAWSRVAVFGIASFFSGLAVASVKKA